MAGAADHRGFAERLRERASGDSGLTPADLRKAALKRAAGGEILTEPYDELVQQIGNASYRVTDEQVSRVREAAGSDKGAFEIVMAAAIGAALMRFDQAMSALGKAVDEAR